MPTATTLLTIALSLAGYLLTLVLLRWVLLTRKEPSSTVAWAMLIVLVPYVGGLLFVVFGVNRVNRRADLKKAADRHVERQLPMVMANQVLPDEAETTLGRVIMRAAGRAGRVPATSGNRVQIVADTHRVFGLIEQAVGEARESLHLEYYIWKRDKTGTRLRDLVVRKAKEGVRVRFLYDGLGSMFLNDRFLAPMRAAGVEVATFLPGPSLRERWSINLRNHRKIVVADGRVGFTGGMNIGDEYLGLTSRGYWRDAHLRVEGPAVLQLQQTFAEDWYFATGTVLSDPGLFPTPDEAGEAVAQVVASGPTGPDNTSSLVMFEAINQARHRVSLTTGYFVPPVELARALQAAALRGVRVRLLVPGRSSYLWTIAAGRSYYDMLLAAGVQIYEYRRGALHAKTLSVDGRFSLVGSANFDARSLALNFEAGLAIYDPRAAEELEGHFDADLPDAAAIDPAAWAARPVRKVLVENACRMFAPVF